MILAAQDLLVHLQDHVWEGWQVRFGWMTVTLMSSAIATMILTAGVLVAVIVPTARAQRGKLIPTGGCSVLEVLVLFIRDRIARPALGEKCYDFLPLLLTLFVFILGMNLSGFLHLDLVGQGVAVALPWLRDHPIGLQPTVVPAICAGLAGVTFLTLVAAGLRASIRRAHRLLGWPIWLCALLCPVLWVRSLVPPIPGITGVLLVFPLALLELIGAVGKCFALMIRLFANMLAGHAMVAALLMFVLSAVESMIREGAADLVYVAPAAIIASVLISLIELLVAGLQAYIFTFLSAIFLSLYAQPVH
ncbi:MAG: F0F1 ATP synthase subunit A [Phycisphaerae bacterium]